MGHAAIAILAVCLVVLARQFVAAEMEHRRIIRNHKRNIAAK
jgi:hypothetical protein